MMANGLVPSGFASSSAFSPLTSFRLMSGLSCWTTSACRQPSIIATGARRKGIRVRIRPFSTIRGSWFVAGGSFSGCRLRLRDDGFAFVMTVCFRDSRRVGIEEFFFPRKLHLLAPALRCGEHEIGHEFWGLFTPVSPLFSGVAPLSCHWKISDPC
jgi:hypothetical protein